MTFLLDVNLLIALIDPTHVHHDRAHRWFHEHGRHGWATCPITENGVIRIVGHPGYPNSPGSPAMVAAILQQMRHRAGHQFWPDDITILDASLVAADGLLSSRQVTDTYLLALARAHRGQLATLDQRLSVAAVSDGAAALHLV